ncbi:MAG: Holliday junction resolvase RuvX [Patescibacteria group bacterium]|jgi:putative Holliday junction resolvase
MNKKYLGIDYGDKRIGLALAEGKGPALPFKVIANDKDFLKNIKEIIVQEYISDIVVGLPNSFSGEENERFILTKNFIEHLQRDLAINIATVDEQLTSKLYEKMGVSKDIDKYAATAILDTYLIQNDL